MGLTTYHRQFDGSVRWRVTPGGVEIENDGHPRSKGAPVTVRRIWGNYRKMIERNARVFNVPVELLVALLATESGGKAKALRKEPGYRSDTLTPHRISAGLTQCLLSTASGTLGLTVTRADLFQPRVSIMLGGFYIRDKAPVTLLDPPLVFARYNAGGVYLAPPRSKYHNEFFMRTHGEHIRRALGWVNDAVFAIEGRVTNAPSWQDFYGA